jgi:hypothetical protein
MDVSITKMCLDTSIFEKSIMGRREYKNILYVTLHITQSITHYYDNSSLVLLIECEQLLLVKQQHKHATTRCDNLTIFNCISSVKHVKRS